jgi:hypothetical protein
MYISLALCSPFSSTCSKEQKKTWNIAFKYVRILVNS